MNISHYSQFPVAELVKFYQDVFSDSEGPAEGAVIGNLVRELLETTSEGDIDGYVASSAGLTGAILFTRMTFNPAVKAFILSPVAVKTAVQGTGVGQRLINHGLAQLQRAGVELVFTYGDPAYYVKTGFEPLAEEMIQAPQPLSQPHGWQCQSLTGRPVDSRRERPVCVKALNKPEYW